MKTLQSCLRIWIILSIVNTAPSLFAFEDNPTQQSKSGFQIRPRADSEMEILFDGRQLATYVYRDVRICRPYFKALTVPGGSQLTRNHPPKPGDLNDHAELHPGFWLAFSDLNGNDYWRLKARIEHVELTPGSGAPKEGVIFSTRNRYLSTDGKHVVCTDSNEFSFIAFESGVILDWTCAIHADQGDLVFGDNEEMGLGIRLSTPIAVKSRTGGRILNAEGQRNEAGVWGKQSAWCDYSGLIDGRFCGLMLIAHPNNPRATWWHARDYGLLVANPFGARSVSRGESAKAVVKKGDVLRLQYRLLLHSNDREENLLSDALYKQYLGMIGNL